MVAKDLQKLDLSDFQLTSIPDEVFELHDLTELSLTGNELTQIPPKISHLTNLESLQLAANLLDSIPDEISALKKLKGLWLYSNCLKSLPESFGELQSLQKCSFSGNRLTHLPQSINQLSKLMELSLPGNQLQHLPVMMDGLKSLQTLSLHGNDLLDLPESLNCCSSLTGLSLQGNNIPSVTNCPFPASLKTLNLADNGLEELGQCTLDSMVNLEELTLYGNKLRSLPKKVWNLPQLSRLWLEGNPLDESCICQISTNSKTRTIGLDQVQEQYFSEQPEIDTGLSFNEVPSMTKGYFKLEKCGQNSQLLVVAFGSAPGNPNWAGVLHKIQKQNLNFDILFLVDPCRSWYGVKQDSEFEHYHSNLERITRQYSSCLMIGKI
eukprot:g6325.t1